MHHGAAIRYPHTAGYAEDAQQASGRIFPQDVESSLRSIDGDLSNTYHRLCQVEERLGFSEPRDAETRAAGEGGAAMMPPLVQRMVGTARFAAEVAALAERIVFRL